MKNLNLLNKIYLAIVTIAAIAIAVKLWRYKGGSRYYYTASVSAPRNYPIYVNNSYFILADGDMGIVSSSEVDDHRTDWGYGDYNEPNQKERLPVKLVLSYASFRDSSFYADTIDLPASNIGSIFRNMGKNGVKTDLYHAPPVSRLDFVIGVANKGNIIIWLRGNNFETTLLKHKMAPHEPVGNDTYHGGILSRKKYFETVFYLDSATMADIQKDRNANASYIDTPSLFKVRLADKN